MKTNHGQTVFRYCDADGRSIRMNSQPTPMAPIIISQPVSNTSGNLLAMMPHPERTCIMEINYFLR
ncbi:MAG: hypothetical protein ACJZ1Y_01920 [Candidatus Neomarinimicrobiota bacterium]